MEPVLIYTDTQRINAEKAFLNQAVTYCQQLYNDFKSIGITLTPTELRDITNSVNKGHAGSNALKDFVADKFLAIAGTPDFNGVPISQARLKELLAIPDLTFIQTTIASSPSKFGGSGHNIEPSLLQVVSDVVSKVAGAFTTIENRYTYYTENDRGAEIVTLLIELCASLNAWKAYLSAGELTSHPGVERPILGLDFKNNEYHPSLGFIRNQEALYVDYVTA